MGFFKFVILVLILVFNGPFSNIERHPAVFLRIIEKGHPSRESFFALGITLDVWVDRMV